MKRPSFKIVERCKSLLSSDPGEITGVLRQNLVTIYYYVDLSKLVARNSFTENGQS